MVPRVKKLIKLGLDQWNQDGTSTTKANRDELWFWKFSSNMEKLEEHYAIDECNNVRKDWRVFNTLKQYWTFLFVTGQRGRQILNTFTWIKKTRDGVETEEHDTTVKALFQKFEDYCRPK